MAELNKLICKIENLRKKLNDLILEKQDLLDPDVIDASKKLDEALNEYAKMKKKQNNEMLTLIIYILFLTSCFLHPMRHILLTLFSLYATI